MLLTRIFLITGLATLAAGSAYAANSANGTGTATVVAAIAITATQDLAFGKLSAPAGTGAGTVIVDNGGGRTKSGGVVLVATGSVQNQAKFNVTGDSGATYAITLPTAAVTITRASGTETMTIDTFTSNPNATGTLTGGAEVLNVGGTLHVAAGQVAGDYTGTFPVQVDYN